MAELQGPLETAVKRGSNNNRIGLRAATSAAPIGAAIGGFAGGAPGAVVGASLAPVAVSYMGGPINQARLAMLIDGLRADSWFGRMAKAARTPVQAGRLIESVENPPKVKGLLERFGDLPDKKADEKKKRK